ncbi:putative RNA-binding protein 34 [Paratrimastix pyriformis]|uniref:RNA-binding protein 34 n=1 Tax=Paratrimastix pyriformis TaxID=342808 RepID=A0ABQ8UFL6_9EUKA|nr:putative RNA-binding protein 34 [Paratrimastix pyriformis]
MNPIAALIEKTVAAKALQAATLENPKPAEKPARPTRWRQKKVSHEEFVKQTAREIFVGSVPVDTKQNELLNLFRPFGKVETCRFRSVPVQHVMPKRAAAMKKVIVEDRSTMNAYVRFAEEATVQTVMEAFRKNPDQFVMHEMHMRLSPAGEKDIDHKRSVFVGGLPPEAEEETVREHFAAAGTVASVRIIRNRADHHSRGFGYVLFTEEESVPAALKLHGSTFLGRELRVFPAMHPKKAEKRLVAQKRAEAAAATGGASEREAEGERLRLKRPKASRALKPTTLVVAKSSGRRAKRDAEAGADQEDQGTKRARLEADGSDAEEPAPAKTTAAPALAKAKADAMRAARKAKLAKLVAPEPASPAPASPAAAVGRKRPREKDATEAADEKPADAASGFAHFFEGVRARRGAIPEPVKAGKGGKGGRGGKGGPKHQKRRAAAAGEAKGKGKARKAGPAGGKARRPK